MLQIAKRFFERDCINLESWGKNHKNIRSLHKVNFWSQLKIPIWNCSRYFRCFLQFFTKRTISRTLILKV